MQQLLFTKTLYNNYYTNTKCGGRVTLFPVGMGNEARSTRDEFCTCTCRENINHTKIQRVWYVEPKQMRGIRESTLNSIRGDSCWFSQFSRNSRMYWLAMSGASCCTQ